MYFNEDCITPDEKEIIMTILKKNPRVKVPTFMVHSIKMVKEALRGNPIQLLDVPNESIFHFQNGQFNNTQFTLNKVRHTDWTVKAYLKPQEKYRGSFRQLIVEPSDNDFVIVDYVPDEVCFGMNSTSIPKSVLMYCEDINELACKYASGRVHTELMDLELDGSFYRKLIAEIK